MSYIDRNLLDGENILFRTKKHFIIFTTPAIVTLLTILLWVELPSLLTPAFGESAEGVSMQRTAMLVLCAIPAFVALVLWFKEWLNYITSDFVVTNKRLIMKEGFFLRRATDTRLSTVSHVTVDQNLLAQILNYGTVALNSFGGSRDAFTQIAKPIVFQQQVNAQLDKIVR